MQNLSQDQLKKVRPYALAMIPFIAAFAYELALVLPHRPAAPDMARGYTISMGLNHGVVYISAGDCALMFGLVLCAAAIGVTGAWQAGVFQYFRRR